MPLVALATPSREPRRIRVEPAGCGPDSRSRAAPGQRYRADKPTGVGPAARAAAARQKFKPRIHVTDSDFASITQARPAPTSLHNISP